MMEGFFPLFFYFLSSCRCFGVLNIMLLKSNTSSSLNYMWYPVILQNYKSYMYSMENRWSVSILHTSSVTAICKGLPLHQGDANTEYSHVWEATMIFKFPSYNWKLSIILWIPTHSHWLHRPRKNCHWFKSLQLQRFYSWHLGKVW